MKFGKLFPRKKIAIQADSLYGKPRKRGEYMMSSWGIRAIDALSKSYTCILFYTDNTPSGLVANVSTCGLMVDSFDSVDTAIEHYKSLGIPVYPTSMSNGLRLEDLIEHERS